MSALFAVRGLVDAAAVGALVAGMVVVAVVLSNGVTEWVFCWIADTLL